MPKRYVGHKSIRKYIPQLPPTEVASKVEGGMGLYRGLKDSLAYLHGQNKNLSSQFITQRGDIRRGGQEATQASAGSALDRGTLGSSNDLIGRGQIRADVASQLQQARTALKTGQMGNASQMMQARRDFDTGMMNLAMMANASKQSAAIAKMLNNAVNSGSGSGRRRNGSGARGNNNGSGGGRNNPSGGGNKTFAQRIQGMSDAQLNNLKNKLTKRMKKRTSKLEAAGNSVYHGKGNKVMIMPGPQAEPSVMKYLTKLNRRRSKVKRKLNPPTGRGDKRSGR